MLEISNHLWQSTAIATVAALLAWALRGNAASVRHWIWFAASLQFLIPFAVPISLGGRLARWLLPAAPAARVPAAVEQLVQPVAPMAHAAFVAPPPLDPVAPALWPALMIALWLCGSVAAGLYGWLRWRRVAAAVRSSKTITEGRELAALRRVGGHAPLPRLVSSLAKLEPGAFGILRPVLWLPAGIAERFDDAELDAVLMHELCHVRRRDNLTAAIHMVVEAIFWFHPLVWWVGARLTEERERACDEEVVRRGGRPEVYAESILKTCEFYLTSPVACAAGITGGELTQRIESILQSQTAYRLSLPKKLMLAAAAIAAAAVPLAFGFVHAADQSFEVAMFRLENPNTKRDYNRPDAPNQSNPFPTNLYTSFHTPLKSLIARAYEVKYNRILGGPSWLDSEHYDLSAKVEGSSRVTQKQIAPMLRNLLQERVHLAVHTERRVMPGYAIVVAKSGSKLKPNTGAPFGGMNSGFEFKFQNGSLEGVAQMIEWAVKQPVVDKTGLTGKFDYDLKFTPQDAPVDSPFAKYGSIFAAVEEQLGLKLVKQPVPVDYLIIDHVDRVPIEN